MTLALAWLRKINETQELIFATDSRLRFGKTWDGSCKLFPFSRGDAVLAFAGDTHYAYPLIHQALNAIELYPKARSRAMDLCSLRGHVIRVFNDMKHWIHDLPRGKKQDDAPLVKFLLGGYSWEAQDFKWWVIFYKASAGRFVHHTPTPFHGNRVAMAGDSLPEFKQRLRKLLLSKGKPKGAGLDYEPFEVLRDMIREKVDPSIGGPPAILKVYKHMNIMPYSIPWPDRKTGRITLLGRPLLDYEKSSFLHLDPDTMKTYE